MSYEGKRKLVTGLQVFNLLTVSKIVNYIFSVLGQRNMGLPLRGKSSES